MGGRGGSGPSKGRTKDESGPTAQVTQAPGLRLIRGEGQGAPGQQRAPLTVVPRLRDANDVARYLDKTTSRDAARQVLNRFTGPELEEIRQAVKMPKVKGLRTSLINSLIEFTVGRNR